MTVAYLSLIRLEMRVFRRADVASNYNENIFLKVMNLEKWIIY